MRYLVVVCLIATAYAGVVPRLDGKIVGGSPIDITEAPYQVSLLLDWFGTGAHIHTCGGSIIRNNVVLSAAHCLRNTIPHQWRIRIGSTFSQSGGQYLNVSRFLEHPGYDAFADFDIAILWLGTEISLSEEAAVIALPAQNLPVEDGASAFVTGWGSTQEGGSASNQLMGVRIPIVNQATCADAYLGVNPVTDRMICAGLLETGGQDACQGDSGGPLQINDVLIGITSWGLGCARPGYPGVWTRVPALRNWIDAELN